MEQPQKELDAIQRAMRKYYEKNRGKIIQYTIERNRLKAGDEKTKEQRRRWNKTYKEKRDWKGSNPYKQRMILQRDEVRWIRF